MKADRWFWNSMKIALVLGLLALMWTLAVSPDKLIDLGAEALHLIEK